ncbi:glycosyltransferase family 4 protein [Candidatus Saccharibacteria bacterium]|nr:glycosyltransferase family 4 protein [Candidatus Saccharibacteria bacterium]
MSGILTSVLAARKIKSKMLSAARIIEKEGFLSLSIRSLQKLQKKSSSENPKKKFVLLVDNADVIKADWSSRPRFEQIKTREKESYTFNWVMSPPGKGSGGHQNLFRFISHLEKAGHKCRIYLYSTIDKRTVAEIKNVLKDSYPKTSASIEWLDGDMKEADGIFATGWETAYPVFNSNLKCRRFYFVQDFEPMFYPMGSEYILAENTYRFGFFGITAGGWLAKKLSAEYGMKTDFFNFGSDPKTYKFTNDKPRKEIFFYARPVTARRGFELGIMALEIFHKKHPEYIINLAGWDVSDYDIPFPYKNLRTLSLDQLSPLYNRCAAGLVMSLTNMSLLPLELLSCGTIPVVNDGENNRLVSDNKFISYVPNNPVAMAEKLSEVVSRKDAIEYSKKAAESVESYSWDSSGKKFVSVVKKELKNG